MISRTIPLWPTIGHRLADGERLIVVEVSVGDDLITAA